MNLDRETLREHQAAERRGDTFFDRGSYAVALFYYNQALATSIDEYRLIISQKIFDTHMNTYEYDKVSAMIYSWESFDMTIGDNRKLMFLTLSGRLWIALSFIYDRNGSNEGQHGWNVAKTSCFSLIDLLKLVYNHLDIVNYEEAAVTMKVFPMGLHFLLILMECSIETGQYGKAHFYAIYVSHLTKNNIEYVISDVYLMIAMWKYFVFRGIEPDKRMELATRIECSGQTLPKERFDRILLGETKLWDAKRYTNHVIFGHSLDSQNIISVSSNTTITEIQAVANSVCEDREFVYSKILKAISLIGGLEISQELLFDFEQYTNSSEVMQTSREEQASNATGMFCQLMAAKGLDTYLAMEGPILSYPRETMMNVNGPICCAINDILDELLLINSSRYFHSNVTAVNTLRTEDIGISEKVQEYAHKIYSMNMIPLVNQQLIYTDFPPSMD